MKCVYFSVVTVIDKNQTARRNLFTDDTMNTIKKYKFQTSNLVTSHPVRDG